MMKILVAGDTHGEAGWIRWLCRKAVERDCDRILQVGDFGFWEHRGNGRVFLEKVQATLEDHDLDLYWIDGNHENHTLLRSQYVTGLEQMNEIRPRIHYIPRGHAWDWNGVSFLGLGGAKSIDKEYRTLGDSWWAEELITEVEVARTIENLGDEYVNVMVTHDCPLGVDIPLDDGNTSIKIADDETYINRRHLLDVVREAQPEILLHGHYHVRYSSVLDDYGVRRPVRIEGLGRDQDMKGGWCVLSLPSLEVS